MNIASHNSWSYLKPKQWYLRPLSFMAKCQEVNIKEQYSKFNVKCFDLRLREHNGKFDIVHGLFRYDITESALIDDLSFLNSKGDCYIRTILDVRKKKDLTTNQINFFIKICRWLEQSFPNIKFWCGENLYNHEEVYHFGNIVSCEEKYSSVCGNKLDDLYPRYYAKKHNKENIEKGTDKQFYMIDFVNLK